MPVVSRLARSRREKTDVTEPGQAIAFAGSRILLRSTDEGERLPTRDELIADFGATVLADAGIPVVHPLGVRRGLESSIFALEEDAKVPAGYRLDGLRVAFHALNEVDFRAAGAARQRVEWFRTHRFCSRCGARNEPHSHQGAMACPSCGQMHFPRVAPAVIVLVQRGEEALLGRSPHFTPGVYSTLAGFVEPGETLEECVHREIEEEVAVQVGNLRYFRSQPHPFPNSLMVGFVAEWVSGEIRLDPSEIEDARWFRYDDLPELPHPMSIARALIEDFVRRVGG